MAKEDWIDGNGWANWETWVVNLWMNNDQDLYEYYGKVARNVMFDATEKIPKDKTSAQYKLSRTLEKQFGEWMPEIEGLYLDLLSGAMSEVNWHQIAKHLIERVEEEKEYAQQAN